MAKLKIFIDGAWKIIADKFPADVKFDVSDTMKRIKRVMAGRGERPNIIVSDDTASFGYPNPEYVVDEGSTSYNIESGVVNNDTSLTVYVPMDTFGNASPSDVASGKTFTSARGIKIVGTGEGGTAIPTDGTAEPRDIRFDKWAYSGGKRVNGTLKRADFVYPLPYYKHNYEYSKEYESLTVRNIATTGTKHITEDGDSYEQLSTGIFDEWTEIHMTIPIADFGDVNAENVPKGMTFTSKAGFKVEGTMQEAPEYYYSGDYAFHDLDDDLGILIIGANSDRLLKSGVNQLISIPKTRFGDARPEDVAVGKTFTSESGLKVVGTAFGKEDVPHAEEVIANFHISSEKYIGGNSEGGYVGALVTMPEGTREYIQNGDPVLIRYIWHPDFKEFADPWDVRKGKKYLNANLTLGVGTAESTAAEISSNMRVVKTGDVDVDSIVIDAPGFIPRFFSLYVSVNRTNSVTQYGKGKIISVTYDGDICEGVGTVVSRVSSYYYVDQYKLENVEYSYDSSNSQLRIFTTDSSYVFPNNTTYTLVYSREVVNE